MNNFSAPMLDDGSVLAVQQLLGGHDAETVHGLLAEEQVNDVTNRENVEITLSNGNIINRDEEEFEEEEDEDILECGKCKTRFNALEAFIHHKLRKCVTIGRKTRVSRMVSVHQDSTIVSASSSTAAVGDVTSAIGMENEELATCITIDDDNSSAVYCEYPTSGGDALSSFCSDTTTACGSIFSSSAVTSMVSSPLIGGTSTSSVMTSLASSPLIGGSLPSCSMIGRPSFATGNLIGGGCSDAMLLSLSGLDGHNEGEDAMQLPSGSIKLCTESGSGVDTTLTFITTTAPSVTEDGGMICDTNLPPNHISIEIPSDLAGIQLVVQQEDAEFNGTDDTKIVETKLPTLAPKPDGDNTEKSSSSRVRNKVCTYCNKSFSRRFDLEQHLRTHTGYRPFQCVVCGKAFAQKSNVKKHILSHRVWPDGLASTLPPADQYDLTNGYRCPYCHTLHETYIDFRSHVATHNSEKVFRCIKPDCGVLVRELEEYLEHVKSHGKSLFTCLKCSRSFRTLQCLEKHRLRDSCEPIVIPEVANDGDGGVAEKIPNSAAVSQNCLMNPLDESGNIGGEEDMMGEVNKASEKGEGTVKVFKINHAMKPDDASLSTPSKLTSTGLRSFSCPHCSNCYATEGALQHHLSVVSHHYACDICGQVFKVERYLRRHLVCHLPAKFQCDLCEKSFRSARYLKRHMETHDSDRPYVCSECGQRFKRRSFLLRHQQSHDGVLFDCPYKDKLGCSRRFYRVDKLRDHVNVHYNREVRQQKCPLCPLIFHNERVFKNHLTAHLRSVHRTLPQKEVAAHNKPYVITAGKVLPSKSARKLKVSKNTEPFSNSLVVGNDHSLGGASSNNRTNKMAAHHKSASGLKSYKLTKVPVKVPESSEIVATDGSFSSSLMDCNIVVASADDDGFLPFFWQLENNFTPTTTSTSNGFFTVNPNCVSDLTDNMRILSPNSSLTNNANFILPSIAGLEIVSDHQITTPVEDRGSNNGLSTSFVHSVDSVSFSQSLSPTPMVTNVVLSKPVLTAETTPSTTSSGLQPTLVPGTASLGFSKVLNKVNELALITTPAPTTGRTISTSKSGIVGSSGRCETKKVPRARILRKLSVHQSSAVLSTRSHSDRSDTTSLTGHNSLAVIRSDSSSDCPLVFTTAGISKRNLSPKKHILSTVRRNHQLFLRNNVIQRTGKASGMRAGSSSTTHIDIITDGNHVGS